MNRPRTPLRRRDRSDRTAAVRATAWTVVALGLSLAGCTSPKTLGDECLFNADCADPLICAGRRCRAQCASNRDCPTGEVCAGAGQAGKKVCVRPQSERLCAFNSDCSALSSCGGGVCHASCGADGDCIRPPSTNTCDVANRVCAEPDRVSATAGIEDGGAPGDAGDDGGAPGDATGDSGAPGDATSLMDVATGDVSATDVAATDGATTDGATTDGATTDGATTDGATTDGATTDGATTDGATTDGATTDTTVSDAARSDAAVLVDGGMTCVGTPDLQNDLDNCGRCGNRCPRPTSGTGSVTCSMGACRTTCATGYVSCNGLCTDPRIDRNHCGGCGIACEVDCAAGVCVNPVEILVNWASGTLVRLSDDTWRGFGGGNWSSEPGATPAVFPWAGSRDLPTPLPLPLTGQNLLMTHPNRLFRILPGGTLQQLGNGAMLADGSAGPRTRWVDVPALTAVRDATTNLNGIYTSSCAAYGTDGRVTCWGSSGAHVYGNPGGVERFRPDLAYPVLRFDDQALVGVVKVRHGSSFTLALRDNGEVWTWGVNGDGRLGLGYAAPSDYASQARRIPSLPPCTAIATGLNFGCALDAAGGVWCWGRNNLGQLGDGTTTTRNVPTPVLTADPAMPTASVPLGGVVSLATSPEGACAITATRRLYCWGYNLVGMVGVGVAGNILRATAVPAPPGVAALRVQSVSLGDSSGCLLTVAEAGPPVVPPRVYCWGSEGTQGYPASGRNNAPTRPVFW